MSLIAEVVQRQTERLERCRRLNRIADRAFRIAHDIRVRVRLLPLDMSSLGAVDRYIATGEVLMERSVHHERRARRLRTLAYDTLRGRS